MVLVEAGRTQPSVRAYTGADLTGNHGTANRMLKNIGAVAEQEIIFIQGAYLHPILDYTKSTIGGTSQYTFLNKVYNQFVISIYYWE